MACIGKPPSARRLLRKGYFPQWQTALAHCSPRRKSGKARIEAPMRKARSSPPAYRGARVIGTDALRLVLILRETSDGQERKQDSEDDPNVNAHESSPAAGSVPADTQRACRARHGSLSAAVGLLLLRWADGRPLCDSLIHLLGGEQRPDRHASVSRSI